MFLHLIFLICLMNSGYTHPRVRKLRSFEELASLINPDCVDKPGLNCEDLDKNDFLCSQHADQARVFCPAYCGLCTTGGFEVRRSTPVTSHPLVTAKLSTYKSTSLPPVTPKPPSAGNTGLCEDSPSIDCADMDRKYQICTRYASSQESKEFCPRFCGLCSVEPLRCADSDEIDCAEMNRTAQICTTRRQSSDTREFCPLFCGLCSVTTTTTTTTTITTTTTPTTSTDRPTSTASTPSTTTPKPTTTTPKPTTTTPKPTTTTPKPTTTTQKLTTTTPMPITTTSKQVCLERPTSGPSELAGTVSMTTDAFNGIDKGRLMLIFERHDVNKDGVILTSELKKMWEEMDTDGDGSVSEVEYSVSPIHLSPEIFSFLDEGRDCLVPLQEVPRIVFTFDSNVDGVIEEGEFVDRYVHIYNFVKNGQV